MLSLSINEFFFKICWDLSPCNGFPSLMKRFHIFLHVLAFLAKIFKIWRRRETPMEVKNKK